jgi:hypothetical protein
METPQDASALANVKTLPGNLCVPGASDSGFNVRRSGNSNVPNNFSGSRITNFDGLSLNLDGCARSTQAC